VEANVVTSRLHILQGNPQLLVLGAEFSYEWTEFVGNRQHDVLAVMNVPVRHAAFALVRPVVAGQVGMHVKVWMFTPTPAVQCESESVAWSRPKTGEIEYPGEQSSVCVAPSSSVTTT
jgi:hypothetical protein